MQILIKNNGIDKNSTWTTDGWLKVKKIEMETKWSHESNSRELVPPLEYKTKAISVYFIFLSATQDRIEQTKLRKPQVTKASWEEFAVCF